MQSSEINVTVNVLELNKRCYNTDFEKQIICRLKQKTKEKT